MGIPVFGDKQLKKCLKNLGFTIHEDKGKGGHCLAKHSIRKPLGGRQFEHITIPHSREYGSETFRKMIFKEIEAFSFTEKQILQAFKKKVKL